MYSKQISWQKTKIKVEQLLLDYNCFCLSVCSATNLMINDDFTFFLVDEVKEAFPLINKEKAFRIKNVNHVRNSYNKLTLNERKIIYWTYLDKENKYDDRFIANNLGFSLGYYYTKKKEALIRFAYALGVEAFDD